MTTRLSLPKSEPTKLTYSYTSDGAHTVGAQIVDAKDDPPDCCEDMSYYKARDYLIADELRHHSNTVIYGPMLYEIDESDGRITDISERYEIKFCPWCGAKL